MAVVDADEGGGSARLDLAVVLQHVVRLHHGEGELAGRVPAEVPRPQQVVGVAIVLILPRKRVPPDPVPARGRNLPQPRPHPSSPCYDCLCSSPLPPPRQDTRVTQFHLQSRKKSRHLVRYNNGEEIVG
jgi:hypothetical protein